MKKVRTKRTARIWSVIVFLIVFLATNGGMHVMILNHENEEKLKAEYTAEITIGRIEAQLNKYLSKTELIKQVIESGATVNDEQFYLMAGFMEHESGALEGIGLAPDGVLTQYYAGEQIPDITGADLFADSECRDNANLAKESKKYVVAGAFEKRDIESRVLVLDPIYVQDESGEEDFWGFSVMLINRQVLMEALDLERLEEASYHYQIWKEDPASGERIFVTQCDKPVLTDAVEVECQAANTTWYMDIALTNGWFSRTQTVLVTLVCFVFSGLIAQVYYQAELRRYKDRIYAEKIKESADEAKAANAAKTNFLSRISHDIRTPLNGIIGLLEIDGKHPDDKELIQKNRGKMLVAANHLLELINDVLQMSKMESGETVLSHEAMDMNELSREILTILEQRAADAGVTLEYDKSSDKAKYPVVYGSPLHLRQLFLNIYGNCIKYNKAGGSVHTEFRYLGAENGKVTYKWIISDTGIGMSQEFVDHIFEPFSQEHTDARSVHNGTGLGMSIVKALIEQMNGTIEVQSKEGEGSTFILTIPFEIAKEEDLKPKQEVAVESGIEGLHFLLAEDNDLNAEIAEMLFQDEGVTIVRASDGQQAVDIFKENAPGTFDAILMDIMMPVMDGIMATKEIRNLERPDAKTIPIIAMTANAFEEDAKRCVEAGMDAHLSKPLQMKQVVETIRECCKN